MVELWLIKWDPAWKPAPSKAISIRLAFFMVRRGTNSFANASYPSPGGSLILNCMLTTIFLTSIESDGGVRISGLIVGFLHEKNIKTKTNNVIEICSF